MLTYNVRLEFPDPAEQARFEETLALQQECWNFASALVFEHSPSGVKEVHDLTYRACRDEFPDLPAQYVIRTYNDVQSTYKTIRSNRHVIDRPARKTSLSVRLDKRVYTIKGDTISVTACGGRRAKLNFTPYPKLRVLMDAMVPCDPLVFERDGEFFLALSFQPPVPPVVENCVLGVDLGEKRLFATSEGDIFIDRRYNARRRKCRKLKRDLRSRGTKSARRKAKKVRRRERNMSRQHVHAAANAILRTRANVIAIEDLKGLKSKTSAANRRKGAFGRGRNNKFSQIPLSQLRDVLEYKAGHAGKRVVAVSPYNTSQNDYRGIKKGERHKTRYYGSDGVVLDSDVNAAINIAGKCATRHKLPISFGNFPVPGLDGQAVVNRPIVCKSFLHGRVTSPGALARGN